MVSTFDIMDLQSPYPFYQWARTHNSLFFDHHSGYWVVTKFNDIKEIIVNENDFSAELERVNFSELSNEAQAKLCPINFQKLYGLSTTENPAHDKVKKVLMPVFNQLFVDYLKPRIEATVGNALERIAHLKDFDIISKFFHPLPAEIIFLILGIQPSDVQKVKDWSESRLQLTWGDKEGQNRHAQNIVNYWNFCKNLIAEKMETPQDDLPSKLLEAHYAGKITLHEIQLLCYGLIFSGHTTTSSFLAESLKMLLESGAWHQHQEKNLPFSRSADELLRLCPSAFTRRRVALKDYHIRGKHIKKGDKLLLVIGSGNRDEEVFLMPDHLDLERGNANNHLTLGRGFHYCIGSRLVKLEYAVVMEQIAAHFPNIRLSPNNKFHYPRNISIRSLKSLRVEVS